MLNKKVRSGKEKRAVVLAAQEELNADELVRLSIDMPATMHKRFKSLCAGRDLSMRDVALSEIRRWVLAEEKKVLEALRALSEQGD